MSPREYLNVIRPYLRNLINDHKPIMELDNDNNNTNTTNNNTDCGEWEIMLRMYIKCISTKSFDETHTMHPKKVHK